MPISPVFRALAAVLGFCCLCGGSGWVWAGEEDAEAATPPPTKPLSIPIPLPIGESAKDLKIPQYGLTGQLLSQLKAVTAKRLDEKRFELLNLVIDLNKPDGKTDFRISLPVSVFNTETRMIHSDEPVMILTSDFELQGARMDFDTQNRNGRLLGWVYMKIHNSKDVAGGGSPKKTPAPGAKSPADSPADATAPGAP